MTKLQNFLYEDLFRFCSYYKQLQLFFNFKKINGSKVLEVGKGTGVFSNYLKNTGINITTIDIDESKNPDYTADARKLPFKSNTFDIICCFEVLEHLPYSESLRALNEFYRVTKKYIIISVPFSCQYLSFFLYVGIWPLDKLFNLGVRIPNSFLDIKYGSKEHKWELGKMGYPKNKFIKDIKEIGFRVIQKEHISLNRKHFFLVAEKHPNKTRL